MWKEIISTIKTVFWFSVFCASTPFLCLSIILSAITNYVCIIMLTRRHPDLEFIQNPKIRTILDRRRNQGIRHVLVQLEGKCDVEDVKRRLLKYIVDRKDKSGKELAYPKLRQTLTTCYTYYAWKKNSSDFDIKNHVIECPAIHRGRIVNEWSIQDYVSTLVSKFMPIEYPPWQILFIETAPVGLNQPGYYMLIKMHHLLLSKETGLNLRDIIMLDSYAIHGDDSGIELKPFNSSTPSVVEEHDQLPLKTIMPSFIYLPQLYGQALISLNNQWNEFVYKYDRTEVDVYGVALDGATLKRKPVKGCFHLAAIALISFVTIVRDFYKGFNATKHDPMVKLQFLNALIQREMQRKDFSIALVADAFSRSFNLGNIMKSSFDMFMWSMFVWIKVCWSMWTEARACIGWYLGTGTVVSGSLIENMQLIINATKELLNISELIITAPKKTYEVLFEKKPQPNSIQNICGRKLMVWSRKIQSHEVEWACQWHNNCSENELYYAAISEAIQTLLEHTPKPIVPNRLNVCIRSVNRDYLLAKNQYEQGIPGYLCVTLPLKTPLKKRPFIIRESIMQARKNQVCLYMAQLYVDLLSRILPTTVVLCVVNYLSKRFTATVSHMEPIVSDPMAKTLWGHPILDVIYFTAPQTNTSIAITLQHGEDYIRLSAICDAQFSPSHGKLTEAWSSYFEELL